MTGPIVVFGANGQVGWELAHRAMMRGKKVAALTRKDADITQGAAVKELIEHVNPALVVNAAGYTAVDKAESEPNRAFTANLDGARNVARAAAAAGAALIHLSTDYVFGGAKEGAWTEDDQLQPLNVYGASKAAGEAAVREVCPEHIILRTSWVYGPHGNNFVKTIQRLARERDELRVISDQHGCPTATIDVADAILDIGAAIADGESDRPWGTYHFCNAGRTTWFGLAEAVVEAQAHAGGRRPTVVPVSTAEYPTAACRPPNSVLDCSRITARFGITRRPWRTGLQDVLERLSVAP